MSRGLQELPEAITIDTCDYVWSEPVRFLASAAKQCAFGDRSQSYRAGRGAPVTKKRYGEQAVWRKHIAGDEAKMVFNNCREDANRQTGALCRVGWQLKDIEKAGDGSFKLQYETPDGSRTVRFYGKNQPRQGVDAVCCPSHMPCVGVMCGSACVKGESIMLTIAVLALGNDFESFILSYLAQLSCMAPVVHAASPACCIPLCLCLIDQEFVLGLRF